MTITGIGIYARTKANLTVAARTTKDIGISFGEERDTLFLMEPDSLRELAHPDSAGLYPYVPLSLFNKVHWDRQTMYGKQWSENPYVTIGGDMVLAPDTAYVMKMRYTQVLRKKGDDDPNRISHMEQEFIINAPKIPRNQDPVTGDYYFQPGYMYEIRIAVYGQRPILVETSTMGWESGDDVETTIDQ